MKEEVLVIGASNTDIAGISRAGIVPEDSNIGTVTTAPGGVGHNIALNIARMGHSVSFITAIGNDGFGREMEKHLLANMDITHALHPERRSGVYLYVADRNGDMYVAVNDMGINETIDKAYLATKRSVIASSPVVVVDANLSQEAIEEATKSANGYVVADCVSTLKVDRLKTSLRNLDLLKPNLMELEFLSGKRICDEESLCSAARVLLDQGLGAVLVTMGLRGAVYMDGKRTIHVPCCPAHTVNATGAGDSFLAGFVAGYLESGDVESALRHASAASSITVESPLAVSEEISRELIEKRKQEIKTDEQISGLF